MADQPSFFDTSMADNIPAVETKPGPPPPAPTATPVKKTISVKRETDFAVSMPKQTARQQKAAFVPEVAYQQILQGLKDFFNRTHFKRGVLGVSGGVDSALTLKLAVDALGAENVFALIMPELGLTSQENIDHAKTLCAYLGVAHHYQPINTFLMDFKLLPWKPSQLATINAKARIRMCLLYNFANTENALVLGTSNKSEMLVGYGTKFGDLACDVEVIGDLLKTEVIVLADYVGLPPEIAHKTPTAELSRGQTDETELGAPYPELDKILSRLHLGLGGCIEHGMAANLTHRVFRLVESNKHKTELPFVIPVKK